MPVPDNRTTPLVKDVIVEDNLVENSSVGLYLFDTAGGTLLRGNQFHNVNLPLWDEREILKKDGQERNK